MRTSVITALIVVMVATGFIVGQKTARAAVQTSPTPGVAKANCTLAKNFGVLKAAGASSSGPYVVVEDSAGTIRFYQANPEFSYCQVVFKITRS